MNIVKILFLLLSIYSNSVNENSKLYDFTIVLYSERISPDTYHFKVISDNDICVTCGDRNYNLDVDDERYFYMINDVYNIKLNLEQRKIINEYLDDIKKFSNTNNDRIRSYFEVLVKYIVDWLPFFWYNITINESGGEN